MHKCKCYILDKQCGRISTRDMCDHHVHFRREYCDTYHLVGYGGINLYRIPPGIAAMVELQMRMKYVKVFNITYIDEGHQKRLEQLERWSCGYGINENGLIYKKPRVEWH